MIHKIIGLFKGKSKGILNKELPMDVRMEMGHKIFFNSLRINGISTMEDRNLSEKGLLEHSKQIFFGTERKLIETYGEYGTQMVFLELIEKIKRQDKKLKENAEFIEMVNLYKKSISLKK